jgi:hypothetical protein
VAKPSLADKITRAMFRVEAANYQTKECRNVALGHTIQAFNAMFGHIREKSAVVEFVQRQTGNSRNATRKKAASFLKRHGEKRAVIEG